MVKNLPAVQEMQVQSLGWDNPLEEDVATHSSILAWRIPRTEEPGRLQSMGCKESDMTEMSGHASHITQLCFVLTMNCICNKVCLTCLSIFF